MLTSTFIEDIFVEFFEAIQNSTVQLQSQDQSAANSFYYVIVGGKELTLNQANFLLKILQKYKILMTGAGLDYRDALVDPKWKRPFRVLDFSKRIFVEKDDTGTVWICAKFPYQLKKEFDDEIDNGKDHTAVSFWDHENKLRKLRLYDANLVLLYEFAMRHNFEIDDTFMIALSEVEEIWQHQDKLIPCSSLMVDMVILENSSDETFDWWKEKYSGQVETDLLLAKSMGFLYSGKPHSTVEKIAAFPSNSFWIKSNKEFFSLYKAINGRVCIILDRTSNTMEWLKAFVNDADTESIDRNDIKVCFRENKDSVTGVNDWIKQNNVGGKVSDGRILIFDNKPAKWLFKEHDDVKLLVSNNLYPSTNQLTRDWFSTHPCVIYLGDIKPSESRGKKIVEL